jgi:hypothetical protein
MDDLVALFEDAEEEISPKVSRKCAKNTPLASDNNDQEPNRVPAPRDQPSQRNTYTKKPSRPLHPDAPAQASIVDMTTPAEASIDQKLGIRMIKRKVSSVDLMDLISIHPYHSPAAIVAMSLAALNRLLVDPAAVVSDATVAGKSNLVTVGIVFSNSGTRVSSNGRAFCVLKIGNLTTGPTLSVFLFGDAYSRHCTSCIPGTVIALRAPKLVPPKEESSDRIISLSVADGQQLVTVAQARDYGTCKGTTRVKQADGRWSSNGACKRFVDTSVSQYCPSHRKQANTKNGKVDKNKGRTFVQQIKSEVTPMNLGARRTVTPGSALSLQTTRSNSILALSASQISHTMPNTGSSIASRGHNATGAIHQSSSLRAPMHMQKQDVAASASRLAQHRPVPTSLSSYTKKPGGGQHHPLRRSNGLDAASSHNRSVKQNETGDWLTEMSLSKKKNPSISKRRAVNMDTGTFDGTVAVPKANKRFRLAAQPILRQPTQEAAHQRSISEKTASVLQNQKLFAERHQGASTLKRKPLLSSSRLERAPISGRTFAAKSSSDSLYSSLGEIDMDKVVAAQSRFSKEADAEAYAKSRQTMLDLERLEDTKTKSDKRKMEKSATLKDSAIEKRWTCKTCNRTSTKQPVICMSRNHEVKLERTVNQASTKEEKRLEMGAKTAEDGGLVLGTGLEWDRRRNNPYR